MVMRPGQDFLMRVVLNEYAVRLAFGNFTDLTNEGLCRHDTDPVAGRLLAGGLVSASLMSVLLDDQEKYSIRLDYDGPVKGMILEANSSGAVRGFIRNPHVMTVADSMETACGGNTTVSVTRSIEGRILNSGQVKTAFITPASVLSYYLSASDQVESEIRPEIELQPDPSRPVRRAMAVLVQALPGCDLEFFTGLRERLLKTAAGEILSDPQETPEKILENLLMFLCHTDQPVTAETMVAAPARFSCSCSGERIRETAMTMLGTEDFQKLLSENPDPVVRCQFCNQVYHLNGREL